MVRHLAYITVANAGTRVRATSLQTDPDKRIPCQAFLVQADPTNSGLGIVGGKSVLYATRADSWGIVGAPSGSTIIPAFVAKHNVAPGPFNLADVYLDSSNNGQKFIISYVA